MFLYWYVVDHINRTEMTNETISKYYKWLSLVTLIVSVVGPLTLSEGTVGEKLWIGLLVNMQFHLAFQFLSRVPYGMYRYVGQESPQMKTIAHKMLNVFSWIIMIFSIIGFVGFISSLVTDRQYDKLIVTMTFIAIFLGGYSFNLKLRKD